MRGTQAPPAVWVLKPQAVTSPRAESENNPSHRACEWRNSQLWRTLHLGRSGGHSPHLGGAPVSVTVRRGEAGRPEQGRAGTEPPSCRSQTLPGSPTCSCRGLAGGQSLQQGTKAAGSLGPRIPEPRGCGCWAHWQLAQSGPHCRQTLGLHTCGLGFSFPCLFEGWGTQPCEHGYFLLQGPLADHYSNGQDHSLATRTGGQCPSQFHGKTQRTHPGAGMTHSSGCPKHGSLRGWT